MRVVLANRRALSFALSLCALGASGSFAQQNPEPLYAVTMSAGWHAPVANHSEQNDRNLMLLGVGRRFVLAEGRLGTASFAPELLPAVTAGHNRRQYFPPCPNSSTALSTCVQNIAYSAFGAGVVPLGLRLQTPTDRRVGLIASIDGGGVWFNERIPTPDGTRFNFLARGTVGVAARVAHAGWISAGVSRIHISNAGAGKVNPGIDANLLTLGTYWR